MTAEHELERRLTGHYVAEAPARAPDWLLEQTLLTIDITPQRRALIGGPWRFPIMNAYAKVAVAAVLIVAVGAIGLTVIRPDEQSGQPATSPSAPPSSAPRSSGAPSPGQTEQTASGFRQPFTYVLPAGAEFEVITSRGPSYFGARIPAAYEELGVASGLLVQAIGGGRTDPCSQTSATLPLASGPRAVIDYLKTIPQLGVSGEAGVTVSGRLAQQALVEVGGVGPECPALWPWAEGPESLPEGPLRLIAIVAGSEHIVLTVFGESANPAWDTMADEFIGSIRFDDAPPASSRPVPAEATPPPLSESFTSDVHGISLASPAGWVAQAATEPWTGTGPALFREPSADFLYDPVRTDHLFMSMASRQIGDATPDEWVSEHLYECTASEPTFVDGATGLIGAGDCNWAAVTTDGRGYMIWLHTSGDEPWLSTAYDRAWFEGVLATVQLHPEDAVDSVASPSP